MLLPPTAAGTQLPQAECLTLHGAPACRGSLYQGMGRYVTCLLLHVSEPEWTRWALAVSSSASSGLAVALPVCLGDEQIAVVKLAGQGAAQAAPWPYVHGLVSGPALQQPLELQIVVDSPRWRRSADKSPLQSPAALPVDVCPPSQSQCTADVVPFTPCRGTATPGT